MDHDFIFLLLEDGNRDDPGVLLSVVEDYNDEGLLAEKFPNTIYFYAKVLT